MLGTTFAELYNQVGRLSTEPLPQCEVRLDVASQRIEVRERGLNWFDRVVCWLEDRSSIFIGRGRKRRNRETINELIKSIEIEVIDGQQKQLIIGICERKQRKNQVLRYRDMVSLHERMEAARQLLRTDLDDIRGNTVRFEAVSCLRILSKGEEAVQRDMVSVDERSETERWSLSTDLNGLDEIGDDAVFLDESPSSRSRSIGEGDQRDTVTPYERVETERQPLRADFDDIRGNIAYCEADLFLQNLLAEVDVQKDYFSPVVKRLYEIAAGNQIPGGNELKASEPDAETKARNFLQIYSDLNADGFKAHCMRKLVPCIADERPPADGLPGELVRREKQLQMEAVTMVLERMDPQLIAKVTRNLSGTGPPLQGGLKELTERLHADCLARNSTINVRDSKLFFKTDPGAKYLLGLTRPAPEFKNQFACEFVIPVLYGLKQILREKKHEGIAESLTVSGLDMEATRNHAARATMLYFSSGGKKAQAPSKEEAESFCFDTVASLLWLQAEGVAEKRNVGFPLKRPETPLLLRALARFKENIHSFGNGQLFDELKGESFLVEMLLDSENAETSDDDFLEFFTLEAEVGAFRAIETLIREEGIENTRLGPCCRKLEDVVLAHEEEIREHILLEANGQYEQERDKGGELTVDALATCGHAAGSEYVRGLAVKVVKDEFGIEKPKEYFIQT